MRRKIKLLLLQLIFHHICYGCNGQPKDKDWLTRQVRIGSSQVTKLRMQVSILSLSHCNPNDVASILFRKHM